MSSQGTPSKRSGRTRFGRFVEAVCRVLRKRKSQLAPGTIMHLAPSGHDEATLADPVTLLPRTAPACQAIGCSNVATNLREVAVCDLVTQGNNKFASGPLFPAEAALCHHHVDVLLGQPHGTSASVAHEKALNKKRETRES